MRNAAKVFLLGGALLVSSALGEVDDNADLSLNALLSMTLETGSFLELDIKNTPLSMTLISKKQIHHSGARHLSELLEIYTPGFQYMVNKWNGTIWGMRGVAGDRNDKVIVLVNGKKQNFQAFHGFATEYTLGLLGDLERIEVLRGPAGLVYGSGAIAGVVNIVTKQAGEYEDFASIKLEHNLKNGFYGRVYEGGTYAEPEEGHKLSFHIGIKESEGLGQNLGKVFGHYELADEKTLFDGSPSANSPQETPGNYLASMDYSVGNFRVYARATRQQNKMGPYFLPAPWGNDDVADLKPLLIVPEGANDSILNNIEEQNKSLAIENDAIRKKNEAAITYIQGEKYHYGVTNNYHHGWIPSERHHIRDNLSVQMNYDIPLGSDRITLKGGISGTTNKLINTPRIAELHSTVYTVGEKRYEIAGQYLFKSINDFQFAIGGEYGLYDIGRDMQEQNITWDMHTPLIANIKYHNYAFFSEAFYNLNDFFALEGGVRYDNHTRTNGVLSPKASLVFHPDNNNTFKFIVQSSSNNADVLSYELTPGVTERSWHYENETSGPDADIETLGNVRAPVNQKLLHSIKPEESVSYEIATYHNINAIRVNSSFSYNQLSQLFLWNSAEQRTVNLGEYSTFSAELDIALELDDIQFGANTVYQIPMELDRDSVEFIRPEFTAKYDSAKSIWVPEASTTNFDTIRVDIVGDQISNDGKNFNNLHTVTSKFYGDWQILDYVLFHSDLRVFWGLWGREGVHDAFRAGNNDAYFLGVDSKPIAKWNASLHFQLSESMELSIFGYDLWGKDDNRHAVRWQQMAARSQGGYFTVDQRTFALKLTKTF